MIVREVVPGRAPWAVVFPDRPPGPLAQIGAPALPVLHAPARLVQTCGFRRHWHHVPLDAGSRPTFHGFSSSAETAHDQRHLSRHESPFQTSNPELGAATDRGG